MNSTSNLYLIKVQHAAEIKMDLRGRKGGKISVRRVQKEAPPAPHLCGCFAAAAVQRRRHRCEKVKVNRVKEATKILTDDADDLAEDSR